MRIRDQMKCKPQKEERGWGMGMGVKKGGKEGGRKWDKGHKLRILQQIFVLKYLTLSSHCGSVVWNLTSIHEDMGSIPVLPQWVKDPALLWPWCRPVATAPIRPLAWEIPYAPGGALKIKAK